MWTGDDEIAAYRVRNKEDTVHIETAGRDV